MANYILLRDNKQNGPLSLEQIVQLGFKPYDLVWVEGKSAAWRYPYEIAELKPFTAVVEEQPFDRFFKKPEEDKPQQEESKPLPAKPVPQKVILPTEKKQEYTPPQERKIEYTPPQENYIPKRSVYVTMPGNISREKEIEKEVKKVNTNPVTHTPVISITETEPEVEIKYSQPLDEIKEMYVKTLLDRKQKTVQRKFNLQNMKRASVFLILIAGGVLAGFVLKSNKKNEPVASNGQVNQPVETVTTIQDNVSTYDQTDETINENKQPTEEWKPPVQNEEPTIKEKDKGNEMLVTTQVKETNSKQQKSVIDPYQTSPGADIDNVTGERSKKERNNYTVEEQTETKTETKQNNSPKLASVKSNNYQRGAFGGIRNLELTVTNKSKYHLDKVVVELQYLKPSEEPLRSEKIVFRSIPAEGTSTIAVPPTNRGIKVVYKIINVESKELTDETAAMK